MANETQDECAATFTVSVALAANEIEVLEQLFTFGPTWDGNIVSKSGRDQLFNLKLASRVEGYSFLTAAGIRLALSNRLDRKKEDKRRREHARLTRLDMIEELVNGDASKRQANLKCPSVEGLEGLEAMLRPENPQGRV